MWTNWKEELSKVFPEAETWEAEQFFEASLGNDGTTNIKAAQIGSEWAFILWQEFSANGFWCRSPRLPTTSELMWFHELDFPREAIIPNQFVIQNLENLKNELTPFLTSDFPKYVYFPDWCSDVADNDFTTLFFGETDALKSMICTTGAKLLYHDPKNCNGNPEMVFEFPTPTSLSLFQKYCFGAEVNASAHIPNAPMLFSDWNEGFIWSEDNVYETVEDLLSFVANSQYNRVK